MKVFCPNCGTENEGTSGSRVTCRACTASFEVPFEGGAQPAPQPQPPPQQPSFGGRPVQSFGGPATPMPMQHQAPPPAVVQPPPNVWTPNQPGAFSAPPVATGGQTNTLAIISLVSGILGCLCIPALGSLAGVITGFIALSQINASNGGQKGRELAIGGIVTSFLSCLGWALYFVIAAVGR